jgi:hypothetical protein
MKTKQVNYFNPELILKLSVSLIFDRTPWKGISRTQSLYLHRTAQHRQMRTNIHALSEIRTHDSGTQEGKTHASDPAAIDGKNIILKSQTAATTVKSTGGAHFLHQRFSKFGAPPLGGTVGPPGGRDLFV